MYIVFSDFEKWDRSLFPNTVYQACSIKNVLDVVFDLNFQSYDLGAQTDMFYIGLTFPCKGLFAVKARSYVDC